MENRITINEQSSIRIDGDKIIYFDPYNISDEPHDADLVFVTHVHPDHFSPADLQKVVKADTVFVSPETMADEVLKLGIKKENLIAMKPGDKAEVLGIPAEAIPAYNILKPMHPKKKGWLGYVVEVENTKIYVCGDIDAIPEGKNVKCDIAIVPIGGFFTMNAKKAADFVNVMKPNIVIPSHYGSLVGKATDAEIFRQRVNESIKVCTKL